MERIWGWIKSHPWYAAAVVFAVGILLWLLLRPSSSASASAAPNPYDAYYGALAASTQSGNSLQAAQNANVAATQQTQISADTATSIAKIQADAATAISASQAGAAVQVANAQAGSTNYVAQLFQQLGVVQSNNELNASYANSANALQVAGLNSATAIELARQQTTQTAYSDATAAQIAGINAGRDVQLGQQQTQQIAIQTSGATSQLTASLAAGLAAMNPTNNIGFGADPSGQVQYTTSRYGGPVDAAAVAQMSPAQRALSGFA
jgi:hypothetical protein